MRVRFFAYLRDYTGCLEADIPYGELAAKRVKTSKGTPPVTVGDLARSLCDLYGDKLRQQIFPAGDSGGTKNGKEVKFGPEIIILINGRHVNHLGGVNAPLTPDDRVDVFPVVAGG